MKFEEIEKIIQSDSSNDPLTQISFKNRSPIKGIFIKAPDYRELSRKNLWRIVTEKHIESYNVSKKDTLAKIFNGSEFTKLVLLNKAR